MASLAGGVAGHAHEHCPPNAGVECRDLAIHAWVIFGFTTGDPLMIHVHLDAEDEIGPLVADEPEPCPTGCSRNWQRTSAHELQSLVSAS